VKDLLNLSEKKRTIVFASSIYIVWVFFTWLLEGRILTLLRPEATLERLAYIIIANYIVGIVIALWLMHYFIDSGFLGLKQMGFRSIKRTIIAVVIGGAIGFAIYAIQIPPSMDPIVISNAFAQVLTVSIAEIVVCWGIIGSSVESLTKEKGKYVSAIAAILCASVLFGIYHFAHSPPFNTITMVLFLTLIGVGTSLFYVIVRDIYGTIVFHNFFGIFGVMQALEATGTLASFSQPMYTLYASAIVAIILLVVSDIFFIRRSEVIHMLPFTKSKEATEEETGTR
jgi:hypothetical protein